MHIPLTTIPSTLAPILLLQVLSDLLQHPPWCTLNVSHLFIIYSKLALMHLATVTEKSPAELSASPSKAHAYCHHYYNGPAVKKVVSWIIFMNCIVMEFD